MINQTTRKFLHCSGKGLLHNKTLEEMNKMMSRITKMSEDDIMGSVSMLIQKKFECDQVLHNGVL